MKIRWRLMIALAIAGILPLIPLMVVVRSAVDVGATSLAPPEISQALDAGVRLARRELNEQKDELANRLVQYMNQVHSPQFRKSSAFSAKVSAGETLYSRSGGEWYRYNLGEWQLDQPPQTNAKAFGGISQYFVADTTSNGIEWKLVKEIPESLRTQAVTLQKVRTQWTLRRYERDRLIMSLVLTYLLAHLLVVGLAVGAAMVVIIPVTRRIERLANVMDAVGADGAGVHRAELQGGGEVQRLASAFNLMIDRLESSRKRAADMEKMAAWRELARVLAHEIKNPLTPIQLSVQQISDSYKGDDEQFSKLLSTTREIVDEEVESLRRLVREFSDFARAPQLELSQESPDEVVRDLAMLYGDRLEISAGTDVSMLIVDREKVKRALINLVENAFQAAGDAAKVRLSIVSYGEMLRFAVEDSGPGVEADRRESIFEPYITSKSSGMGLGLPVVRSVARQHGGDAWVEDSVDLGGAAFIFEIPISGPAQSEA